MDIADAAAAAATAAPAVPPEHDDGCGNNNDQHQAQQDAARTTSSSLTSSTTSDDNSGPATADDTTTTAPPKADFYYRNVHNLPNAKKMRTATSASYASSEGSGGGESGSHGGGGGGGGSVGCQSPSPLLSARDAPSMSNFLTLSPSSSSRQQQHAAPPPRQAIFSPPTGLEKRFEEVLRLEDTATTEYKMGQRIKMNNKLQSVDSVSGPASTTTMTMTTTGGSTASAAAGGGASSSSGDDRNENYKNNSDATTTAAKNGSRIGTSQNQETKGQGVGNQERDHHRDDDDDDDEDGDDGDYDSSVDDALVIPDITQEELEKLLYAKDMYEMSAAEREYVLQDIHGVADMTAQEIESSQDDIGGSYNNNSVAHNNTVNHSGGSSAASEFVKLKRQQLQQALLQSPTHGTAAYSQAVRVDYGYVTSSEFQLPFLRSNQWDVEGAAKQIINYFDIKLQLFGPELLCKPKITLGDLSKEDRKQLETGFFQFLPVRDVVRISLQRMIYCFVVVVVVLLVAFFLFPPRLSKIKIWVFEMYKVMNLFLTLLYLCIFLPYICPILRCHRHPGWTCYCMCVSTSWKAGTGHVLGSCILLHYHVID